MWHYQKCTTGFRGLINGSHWHSQPAWAQTLATHHCVRAIQPTIIFTYNSASVVWPLCWIVRNASIKLVTLKCAPKQSIIKLVIMSSCQQPCPSAWLNWAQITLATQLMAARESSVGGYLEIGTSVHHCLHKYTLWIEPDSHAANIYHMLKRLLAFKNGVHNSMTQSAVFNTVYAMVCCMDMLHPVSNHHKLLGI